MKKLLTLLLAAIMVAACCFSLTACGHKHDYAGVVTDKGTCTTEGTVKWTCKDDSCKDTYETKTGKLGHSYKNGKCVRCGETAEGVKYDTVKVGLICLHDENSTYDKNFIDAFKAACEAKGVEYLIKTGIPEGSECKEAADDLVDKGCNLIFADSFGHEPFMIEAAKEHTNVQFFHATGTKAHTSGLKNYHNAFASIYEGRYLAGVAAGMKLKEMIDAGQIKDNQKDANGNVKVGYVGAFTYAEVISGFTSWYLGVRSIVNNVVMDVQFTGSWYDETAEKEAANTLINGGCALISQHADSWGAPNACETAKVPNVSYNGSTEEQCPETFIVSSRINWEPYYEYFIECAKKGTLLDTDWANGLGTTLDAGSVVLTALGKKAPAAGTQEKLDEVAAALKNGTLKVFDCSKFTVGGKALTSYLADVDDWGDYVPETEVVKTVDGVTYFAESEFRSAPYFDIQIDGINYLNVKF